MTARRAPLGVPSTLITSPVSQLDFTARLAFFALAPFGIVRLTALFPMWGALLNVALVLVVFLAREAIHARSRHWPWLGRLFSRELMLDAHYRLHPPRSFLYYVFYPLLFPYWLLSREARREFLLFKGYTLTSVLVLLASVVVQYFTSWRPDLGVGAYLPVVGITLGVEMILVLALLMPIATTVIGLHQSGRRLRLVVLLLVALSSTTVAIVRITRRRDPVVSYATRERVRLRTAASPSRARDAEVAALRMSWAHWRELQTAVEGDGKVEGEPLEAAHAELEKFFKHDEAYAFDLWATPQKKPDMLVLYFEARQKRAPIWIAMKRGGATVRDPKFLPKGAFAAMLAATE